MTTHQTHAKAAANRQKPSSGQGAATARTPTKKPVARRKKADVRALPPTTEGAQQLLLTTTIPFVFKGHSVRGGVLDGQPWFSAADVCGLLAIKNSSDAVAGLEDYEKGVATTDTIRGKQALTVVNESGLYRLIFVSRKPEAKVFRRWVTAEVLPEIRRTGCYNAAATEAAPEPIGPLQVRHEVFDRQLLACALTTTAAYWHKMLQVRAVGDDHAEVLMLNKLERAILDGSILGAECLLSMQRGESAVERV